MTATRLLKKSKNIRSKGFWTTREGKGDKSTWLSGRVSGLIIQTSEIIEVIGFLDVEGGWTWLQHFSYCAQLYLVSNFRKRPDALEGGAELTGILGERLVFKLLTHH
jgi:hypothetical protein